MDEQSELYRMRILLFEGLNRWKSYLQIQKKKRAYSLNAMLFLHSHLLQKSLNRWKASKKMKDQIRIKCNNIIVRNQNKAMFRSFRTWFKLYAFKQV